MAKVHLVKNAAQDYPQAGIKKGESYYWWAFYGQKRQISKEMPKKSQTVSSEFLQEVYSVEEDLGVLHASKYPNPEDSEDLSSDVGDFVGRIQDAQEECQSKYDDLNEGFQAGPTGELLQGRVDSAQEMIDAIEVIDLNFDPDGDESYADWLQGRIDELQAVSYEGE